MSRSPRITGADLIAGLAQAGFRVLRVKGSHCFLRHEDGRSTVVPVQHSNARGEKLELVEIAPVVAFLIDGGFEDKGFAAKFRVGEDAAEGVRANVALAYIGVAIDVRGPGKLAVVGMNHVHVGEAEQRLRHSAGCREGRLE